MQQMQMEKKSEFNNNKANRFKKGNEAQKKGKKKFQNNKRKKPIKKDGLTVQNEKAVEHRVGELESRTTYGPQIAFDHAKGGGDPNVTFPFPLNTDIVYAWAYAIVQVACKKNEELASTYNLGYIVIFLANYIINEAIGVEQNFPLDYAPKVFWDLVTAVRRKKVGTTTLEFTGAVPTLPTFSTANWGAPMGTKSSAVGVGYYSINVSMVGYVAQPAAVMVKQFLDDCTDILHCVKSSSYKGVPDDDASIYTIFIGDTGPGSFVFQLANGTSYTTVGRAACPVKIKTPWLARLLACTDNTSGMPSFQEIKVRSTPASMIAHRIFRGYSTYDAIHETVRMKFVDINDVANIIDKLQKRVETLTSAATKPFFQNGVGLNDFKFMVNVLVRRWCNEWLAVGSGAQIRAQSPIALVRILAGGAFQTPNRNVMGLKNFAVIEDAFSRLYVYKRGNVYFYPVPYSSVDLSSFTSSFAADALLTVAWNWVSNIVTASEVAAMVTTNWQTEMLNWNTAMAILSAYGPISTRKDESRLNLASMTYLINESNYKVRGHIFNESIPDHLESIIDKSIIPVAPLRLDAYTPMSIASVQQYYKERRHIPVTEGALTQQEIKYPGIIGAISTAVNPKDEDANYVNQEQEDFNELQALKGIVSQVHKKIYPKPTIQHRQEEPKKESDGIFGKVMETGEKLQQMKVYYDALADAGLLPPAPF